MFALGMNVLPANRTTYTPSNPPHHPRRRRAAEAAQRQRPGSALAPPDRGLEQAHPDDPSRAGIPDWGRTDPEDVRANLCVLEDGSRVTGFYSLGGDNSTENRARVWVITDAVWPDTGRRWLTTILTPWEY